MEEPHRGTNVVARDRYVKEPVVFKILGDDAISHGRKIQASSGGDVDKTADVLFRFESRWRYAVFLGNTRRILSDRHVGEIQKPLHLQLIRPLRLYRQILQKILNGLIGIVCQAIRLGEPRWKEAPISRIAIDAVLHFRFVEISHAEHFRQLRNSRWNFSKRNFVSSLPVLDSLFHVSLIGLQLRQRVV